VHNGVDVDQFTRENGNNGRKQNDSKELLFVGRVSPEKGVHVLIDALRIVTQHYPKARLKIVGSNGRVPMGFIVALSDDEKVAGLSLFYDGKDYNTHLQEKLSSLNIERHATFAGSAHHSEVVNYYREADVLVNPSLSESFGMSLVEAMSCQVPVVATRVGGMQEIVRGSEAGLLVEPGDPQALAEAIVRVLSQDELRKAMGKAGRQRAVELFSWDRIAERMLGYYQNICECQAN
jgi:glycosyltransferase involved in cell wall biosynthesis